MHYLKTNSEIGIGTWFLNSSILLGFIFLLIYIFNCLRLGYDPFLSNAIIDYLAGCILVSGIKLCILALSCPISSPLCQERKIIFLGGLVVVWISIQTLIKSLLI